MEKNKTHIPAYDREPSAKGFKKAVWGAMLFIMAYGGFLIWKNYYKEGATPPLERKQLSVPSYMLDSNSVDQPQPVN